MGTPVVEERLGAGLACLRFGTGPPLLFLPGLAAHHRLPHGTDRKFQLSMLGPYARSREVRWLQLAADHPDLVRRLVLLSSACRLGPAGRQAQRRVAALVRENRPRRAGAEMMAMLGGARATRTAYAALGLLLAPVLVGGPDMLATIDAEDAFDLTDRLPSITTPTLVVGGARDPFYGVEVFEETAAGLPRGRLLLHPDKGHGGALSSRVSTRAALAFLDG